MTGRRSPGKIIPRAFPGITSAEVEELVTRSRLERYPPGVVLCQENALESTFYMILEGEVEVTKVINNDETRRLNTLGPGDFFGEMALIHNAPRAATVTTRTDLVTLELDKPSFDAVLARSSSVSMALVREISNRLRENDAMAIEDLRLRARELAQAYEKLAELEAARNAFLTNIAHELRTPLMAASGFVQVLEHGIVPADQWQNTIAIVSKHIRQIVTLVNDLLFLQEMDLVLPEFQPVQPAEIVDAVVRSYRGTTGIHDIQVTTAADLPALSGDRKSLERAIAALVDNAIKFSPQGGKVDLRLRQAGEEVVVQVEDHGIGIAPEILPRIFERFFHLEKDGEVLFGGVGIGLAIARQVIHQHGGVIEVASQPGAGTTFTVRLPVARPA